MICGYGQIYFKLFFANIHNVFAQFRGDRSLYNTVFHPLRTRLCAPWSRFVTFVTVFARRLESGTRMIRPYICRLHTGFAILAICHGVPRQSLHKPHFAHPPPWIFYKPVFRVKFINKPYDICVHTIAFGGIVGFCQQPQFRIAPAVMGYSRNRICRAIGACPYNIGLTKPFDNICRSYLFNIGTPINAVKSIVPIHAEHFVSTGFKRFANRACPCE